MATPDFLNREPSLSDATRHTESGATIAEFALILPLLLIILFGIIEFGIAFTRAQAVEAAAREGARLASLGTTSVGDVNSRVSASYPFSPSPSVVVTPNPAVCNGRQGESVTVQVTAAHSINIPLLATYNVNLTGQAVFRCEAGG